MAEKQVEAEHGQQDAADGTESRLAGPGNLGHHALQTARWWPCPDLGPTMLSDRGGHGKDEPQSDDLQPVLAPDSRPALPMVPLKVAGLFSLLMRHRPPSHGPTTIHGSRLRVCCDHHDDSSSRLSCDRAISWYVSQVSISSSWRALADDLALLEHDDLLGVLDGGRRAGSRSASCCRRSFLKARRRAASVLKSRAEKLSSKM